MSGDYLPLVKLAGLYENQSQKTGQTYFVGYLGSAKVLLLKGKHTEEGQPGWNLMIQERPPKGDGQQPQGQYQRGGQQPQGQRTAPPPSNQGPPTDYGNLPY